MASINGLLKLLKIRPRKDRDLSDEADDYDDWNLIKNDKLGEDDDDRISHIYEEIPCSFVDDEGILPVEHKMCNLDFKNARDIGPYIVVPILGCYGNQVLRKDEIPIGADEHLPSDLLSTINCPRNRQFNVIDNAKLCENLDKNSTYCTIPAHENMKLISDNNASKCLVNISDQVETHGRSNNDSDDSGSEYDMHGVSKKDYMFHLARAKENLKMKHEVLKLVSRPSVGRQDSSQSSASVDENVDPSQEDAVSVTTNASDCTSNSSDSGNASLYNCSDLSSCSEGTGSLWYETTESLSIDVLSGDDYNCPKTLKDSENLPNNQTKSTDAIVTNEMTEKKSTKTRREARRKKKRDNLIKDSKDIQPLYRVVTFIRNETDRMSCRATDCTVLKRRQSKPVRTNNNTSLYGSNNRALNDLMKMNHDKQLFIM